MHISSTLMLSIGGVALSLFVAIFIVALIITFRNRRKILSRSNEQHTDPNC